MPYDPPPGWVPPWMDKATLAAHICLSDTAIDSWVKIGLLPAPRKRGGKLMWRWAEVDRYLMNGGPGDEEQSSEDRIERIRNATRQAVD